jgi:hypothetical protein
MAGTQTLFDTLSGAFGHSVDRPGLEAFVANSQTLNGLRSAQTEAALTNAQQSQEEMAARAKLEDTIAGTLGPDGTPMFTPSQAHMAAQSFIAQHGGKVADGIEALMKMQTAHNTNILSNPANLNSPDATAAAAGNTNKLPEAVLVPKEYTVPPGMTPPVVQQTPLGAAETGAQLAMGNLRTHQATSDSSLSDDAAYNAAIKYNSFGTLPSLGMGASSAGARQKVLTFAAYLSHDPNWHPPSWDAAGSPAGATPTTSATPTSAHPTLQNATDVAAAPADMKAQAATMTDMTKRTSVADASEQTALKNLGLAREMLSKADQSGSPLANSIQNKIRSGLFGDPQVSAYQNAISTARNEYARVISMATGAQGITDYAMREGQKLFPDDLAPAQFDANYQVAAREMANRTGAMHDQISQAKAKIHSPAGTVTPPAGGETLPSYPDEASALAAGHRAGDRVIIGGVTGTLQ